MGIHLEANADPPIGRLMIPTEPAASLPALSARQHSSSEACTSRSTRWVEHSCLYGTRPPTPTKTRAPFTRTMIPIHIHSLPYITPIAQARYPSRPAARKCSGGRAGGGCDAAPRTCGGLEPCVPSGSPCCRSQCVESPPSRLIQVRGRIKPPKPTPTHRRRHRVLRHRCSPGPDARCQTEFAVGDSRRCVRGLRKVPVEGTSCAGPTLHDSASASAKGDIELCCEVSGTCLRAARRSTVLARRERKVGAFTA
ncbi:hypothetical protein FKP32DRAFT_267404 [Trametes sanguinea]|nr:hypothetical protein FKP32DRAFT_267404 [Trametes sanguinea]